MSGWKVNLERLLAATMLAPPLDESSGLLTRHPKALALCIGLKSVPQTCVYLEPMGVTLFGERLVAVKMRSY